MLSSMRARFSAVSLRPSSIRVTAFPLSRSDVYSGLLRLLFTRGLGPHFRICTRDPLWRSVVSFDWTIWFLPVEFREFFICSRCSSFCPRFANTFSQSVICLSCVFHRAIFNFLMQSNLSACSFVDGLFVLLPRALCLTPVVKISFSLSLVSWCDLIYEPFWIILCKRCDFITSTSSARGWQRHWHHPFQRRCGTSMYLYIE